MTRAEFKVVARLVFEHARHRPGRVALTTLSTAAAACIVVWVVSGYDALVEQFGAMNENYMGRYEVLVLPTAPASTEITSGPPGRAELGLPAALIESLRRDPAVVTIDRAFDTRVPIRSTAGPAEPPAPAPPVMPKSGPILMGGMAQLRAQARNPTLVGTDSAEPVHPIFQGRWFEPDKTGTREAAITRDSAEAWGVKLGDELIAGRGAKESRLKVIAILEQPKRLPSPRFMVGLPPSREAALQGGPAGNAVYVPMALAEELAGTPSRTSNAGVVLKPGQKVGEVLAGWSDRLAKSSPPAMARTLEEVGEEVSRSTTFESARAQAYSAMGISLLAALFIIFTTLSMGVDERIRQFAMLRAVSLTRGQVGAMVVGEAALLGLIGWSCGLLAGWGLLRLMAQVRPESMTEGASLGGWSVALSGVCALGGSMAASVLPVWRATRISPVEAMARQARVGSSAGVWPRAIAGLILIAINPIVVFALPLKGGLSVAIAAALGCAATAIGFVLLAPLAVVTIERWLGPALARVFGLSPRLLASQLSTNMGRTVGTTVALTIGLGLFVAMQTWGTRCWPPSPPATGRPTSSSRSARAAWPSPKSSRSAGSKGSSPASSCRSPSSR